MGDTGNAMLAAIAITAALYHREKTGEGQAVSTSIVNAGLLHTSYAWIDEDGAPAEWGHVDGDQYGLSPFYRLYQCADDGWVFVAAVRPETGQGWPGPLRCPSLSSTIRVVRRPSRKPSSRATGEGAGSPRSTRQASPWSSSMRRSVGACSTIQCTGYWLGGRDLGGQRGPVRRSRSAGQTCPAPLAVASGGAMHVRRALPGALSDHGYSKAEVDALAADGVILDAAVDTT